jgi:hypothetical protein
VKSENLLNPSWWEFRHPQFIKGQPRLLSEIKRAVHYTDGSNSQDVAELRSQVSSLTSRLSDMNESIVELTSMVSNMTMLIADPKLTTQEPTNTTDKSKKRRTRGLSSSSSASASTHAAVEESDESAMLYSRHGERNYLPTGPELADSIFRSDSKMSDNLLWDDSTLENLMSMEQSESSMVVEPAITATAVSTNASTADVLVSNAEPFNGQNILEMSQLISSLSPELQARFVDKLAESMGAHLSSFLSNSAISSPTPVTTTAPSRYEDVKESESANQGYISAGTPAIALPLASAAISALFSRMSSVPNQANINPHLLHNNHPVSRELIQASS